MTQDDKPAFIALLQGVFAYHRQALSPALMGIYWRGCERWSMEQVTKALDSLTADPEAGRFLPKIGDVTRVLEGTQADRSMIAWGKVHEAMSAVGAHTDVVFDDPAIHATVQDMGGWPKVCRTETKELGFVQTAFCKAHRAYVGREKFEYPNVLSGESGPDQAQRLAARGLPMPAPVFVGEPAQCQRVLHNGNTTGKVKISQLAAVVAIAIPHRPTVEQDDVFEDVIDAPLKGSGGKS